MENNTEENVIEEPEESLNNEDEEFEDFENVYEFDVPEQAGEWRYFIVADIRGMPKESPPDKQGCEGEVAMWKVRNGT